MTEWSEADVQILRDGYATSVTARTLSSVLGKSPGAIRAKASRLGIRFRKPGRNLVHGTGTGYDYGCRCPECRKAHAARAKGRNKRRRERLRAGTGNPTHGRPCTYSNWGCRCEPCSTAWAASCRANDIKAGRRRA